MIALMDVSFVLNNNLAPQKQTEVIQKKNKMHLWLHLLLLLFPID